MYNIINNHTNHIRASEDRQRTPYGEALSFHKENSALAEGLVLLRGRILESSSIVVLCVRCRPSDTLIDHYSFRIAASGLSFIARAAGTYPAIVPTAMAKPIAKAASQSGMLDSPPVEPEPNIMAPAFFVKKLMI